jgi:hypothetical protein
LRILLSAAAELAAFTLLETVELAAAVVVELDKVLLLLPLHKVLL